jgi:hypothetical protein
MKSTTHKGGQKLPAKDREGNVQSPSADKIGNVPAVDANEEEGSSASRPGYSSNLRNARTDESGARIEE